MKKAITKRKDGKLEIVSILDEYDIIKEAIEKIGSIMNEYYKTEEKKTAEKESRKEKNV